MTAPLTATKPKAHRSRAAKQDKPSADAQPQQQQPAVGGLAVAPVVLKPAITVAPVIRTSESTLAPAQATGLDRQRKRQTTTTISAPSTRTGKWSKSSEEDAVPENPGAAGGSIFNYQVDAAEGEEKDLKMGTAFVDFAKAWSGEAVAPKEADTSDTKSDTPDTKSDIPDTKSDVGEAKHDAPDTKSGAEEPKHEPAFDREIGGFEMKGDSQAETKTGSGAAVGDFAADPTLFKMQQIIAFADERREEKGPEGTYHEAGNGTRANASISVKSRKGATIQESKAHANALVGFRASAKTLAIANDEELVAAVTALAQAGAFADGGASYDVKKGRAALKSSATASGGAGVQARGRAVAQVDLNGLVPTLVAYCEGAVQIGIWGDVAVSLKGSYGKVFLSARVTGAAFAGASAEGKAGVMFDSIEGLGFSAQGAAKAGAEASATATQTLGMEGIGELEFEEGVLAFAGAQAKAKATAAISLTGVTLQAKASAFAGAKASAWVSVAGKLRGREVVKVGGTVTVSTGAGAEVSGQFMFQGGRMTISGDLAAALKVGGGVGGKIEVDFAALSTAILQLVADEYNKEELKIDLKGPAFTREAVTDKKQSEARQQLGYDAVIDEFDQYAVEILRKISAGKPGKKSLGGGQAIDPLRLQKIIQKQAVLDGLTNAYKETDWGIERAAEDAFGEILKVTEGDKRSIHVDGLVVRSVVSMSPAALKGVADQHAISAAQEKARAGLVHALHDYADKKTRATASRVTQKTVQETLDKHWSSFTEAYPVAADAAGAAASAVTDGLGELLRHGDAPAKVTITPEGKISEFPSLVSLEVIGFRVRNEHQVAEAHAVLTAKLQAFLTQILAPDAPHFQTGDVTKILIKAAAPLGARVVGPGDDAKAVRDGLLTVVRNELGPYTTAPVDYEAGDLNLAMIKWDRAKITAAQTGASVALATTELAGQRAAILAKAVAPVTKRMNRAAKSASTTAPQLQYAIIDAIEEPVKEAVQKLTALDPTLTKTAIDQQLQDAINRELDGLFSVTIADGAVAKRSLGEVANVAKLAEKKRLAKAKLTGGEEQDNDRRRLVSLALQRPFQGYADEIHAQIASASRQLPGKEVVKGVEGERLQKIIEKKLDKIRNDIDTTVGDEAIVDVASATLGVIARPGQAKAAQPGLGLAAGAPLLKTITSSKLKVSVQAVEPATLVDARRTDQQAEKAERVAADAVRAKFRAALARRNDPDGRLGLDQIHFAILEAKLDLTPPASADAAILMAIAEQFGSEVLNVKVAHGDIEELKYKPQK
ncbi:MAG: hypothetical protein ABI345_07110 [Jatrophihabitans sp.]